MEHKNRYPVVGGIAGLALGIGGWGASMSGYINPPLGNTLMFIGALVLIIAIGWGVWPTLSTKFRRLAKRSKKLSVTPKIEYLGGLYPGSGIRADLEMGLGVWRRGFGVLTVRNEGDKDLLRVVSHCRLTDKGEEIPCVWITSGSTGRSVSQDPAFNLYVGHSAMLVIGQAFEREKLWARLPKNPKFLLALPSTRDRAIAERHGSYFTSLDGETLDLGRTIELTVTFRAERWRQEDRVSLGFDSDGPTIATLTP